jgi:hypothetical protein
MAACREWGVMQVRLQMGELEGWYLGYRSMYVGCVVAVKLVCMIWVRELMEMHNAGR